MRDSSIRRLVFVCVGCTLAWGIASVAVAKQGTQPMSFRKDVMATELIDHKLMPAVGVDALLLEDLANELVPGVPFRVAEPQPADFTFKNSGVVEHLGDGGVLWRLRVSSPGAYFLSFTLTDFELPKGARLWFHSVERVYYDGPYTYRNNNVERRFGSPIVPGDSAVIEVHVPAGVRFEPFFKVAAVSHGYRDFRHASRVPYRDGRPIVEPLATKMGSCEIDVNCPEGNDWQDDKRAVAEIFDGTFVCSGQMVNNVREDCRDFFLTANHCVKSKGKASSLVFYWNYENSACGTNDAPIDQTSVGSDLRAGNSQSDFTLLELFSPPDPAYFVYHTGWNRSNVPPPSAVTIHHPNDLPKKISFEFDPVEDGGNFSGGWGDDHWRIVGWDIGTTEPGSSGAGLWNPSHQVIGQLHGGTGDCDGGWDEFGKIFSSWTAGLGEWLDPDGTGAMSVNGKSCVDGTPPPPPPACELGQVGDPCTNDADCCSNKCRGPAGGKTCKG